MKIGVMFKIDVTKIDKARLFQGKKGTYLDAQAFIDLENTDQYGSNGRITQAVSKDERAAGEKGRILGDAKIFWQGEGKKTVQQKDFQESHGGVPFDDSVPF